MQQRQPRLGDVLDDYCPRERRLTNHVVVAMIGDAVKQTRCSTCDADHEYKAAKVPRLRRKTESPAALAAQGFAVPKLHEQKPASDEDTPGVAMPLAVDEVRAVDADTDADVDDDNDVQPNGADEGPVHRRLIRASLPRIEGQAPPTRPNPEFTIRQPNNGRQNRFRPRPGGQGQGRGPMTMNGGNGGNGNGNGNRSFGGGGYSQSRQPNQGQGGGQNRRHGGGGRNRPK